MLPFFPASYPGEMLYSVMSRLYGRLGFPLARFRRFFGISSKIRFADPFLPISLQSLAKATAQEWKLTPMRIVRENTVLPYYYPFNSEDLGVMYNMGAYLKYLSLFRPLGYKRQPDIAFCPQCVRQDLDRNIEPYLRRVHHVYGNKTCPWHGCQVVTYREKQLQFDVAARLCEGKDIVTPASPAVLVTLAKDLETSLPLFEKTSHEEIRKVFATVASNHGYDEERAGRFFHKRVREYVQGVTMPKLSRKSGPFGGYINDRREDKGKDITTQPFWVLLLMRAVDRPPEDFFRSETAVRKRCSWPCLNVFCEDYKTNVITKFDSSKRYTPEWGPRVALQCPKCGFGYLTVKIEAVRKNHPVREVRVANFGDLWREGFTRVWTDPAVQSLALPKLMAVGWSTMFQAASAYGLPLDRGEIPGVPLGRLRRYQEGLNEKAQRLASAKSKVLQILVAHPKNAASRIQLEARAELTYVYHYDRAWHDTNVRTRMLKRKKSLDLP